MTDQLQVFISSTIGECAAERKAVQRAVLGLRHVPFLFEAHGADAHPPRQLYIRHLMEADIFVGIYRESYGWIDPRGEVSGIHDEHNLRRQRGRALPALVYVLRDAAARDPRLTKLIDEAKPDSTLFFYDSPEELEERLAADLARLMAQGFEPSKFAADVVASAPMGESTPVPSAASAIRTDALNLLRAAQVPSPIDGEPLGVALSVEDLAVILKETLPGVLSALSTVPKRVAIRGDEALLLEAESFDSEPAKQFYGHKLAKHLMQCHRPLQAYLLLRALSHPLANAVAFAAAMVAVRAGNVKVARFSLANAIEVSRVEGRLDEYAIAILNLVRINADSGRMAEARELVDRLRASNVPDWGLSIQEASLELDAIVSPTEQVIAKLVELKDVYRREGDHAAARVAILLSRLHIHADRFEDAVSEAQFALDVFVGMGNRYGCRTALTNLVAAQSAAGHDAAAAERKLNEYLDEPEASARMECFRCNVASRKARELGNDEAALRLSERAIELAVSLGDKRAELLNRINRGNALRGLGRLADALRDYEAVSADASRASMLVLEADATRLAAGIHNRQGQHGKAILFAQHSVALLQQVDAKDSLMRALREKAVALEKSRQAEQATAAYLAAAKAARSLEDWTYTARNMVAMIRCLELQGSWESLPGAILDLFNEPAPTEYLSALMDLASKLPSMLASLPPTYSGGLTLRVFQLLLKSWKVDRPWQALEPLIESTLSAHGENGIRFVLGMLSAVPSHRLQIWEWVRAAELVCAASTSLTFKPESDGTGPWTIRFGTSPRVLGTIAPIDASPTTFYVSLVSAYLISRCGAQLTEALGTSELPRLEFQIMVGTSATWLAEIPDLAIASDASFGISRAADEMAASPPPQFMWIGEGFSADSGHLRALGGTLLYELARHLVCGKVNDTALRRWIPPLARDTMF